jgi:hypothetical protein
MEPSGPPCRTDTLEREILFALLQRGPLVEIITSQLGELTWNSRPGACCSLLFWLGVVRHGRVDSLGC